MMKTSVLSAALTVAVFTTGFTLVFGQAASPVATGSQGQPNSNPIVRIGVTLVQVDAVVTDAKGNHIPGLKPEDFEIDMDGHPQDITHFSYVVQEVNSPAASANPLSTAGSPQTLKPDQVRRVIAIVLDDLLMSFESTVHVRAALNNFVDDQMQPGDLAAIFRTTAGLGVLQQFTSDKRLLHSAIDQLRYHPFERNLASVGGSLAINAAFYRHDAAVGVMETMRPVVQDMAELPGRKSVLLVTDGVYVSPNANPGPVHEPLPGRGLLMSGMQRVIDSANRSGVAIYTLNSIGLPVFGPTAADNPPGLPSNTTMGQKIASYEENLDRQESFFFVQHGTDGLADETGGFPIFNHNDLNKAIGRVLNDQTGYYLIGFAPDEATFRSVDGKRSFHRLTIKLKRKGLTVRSQKGFYGITDDEERSAETHSPQRAFRNALLSPFASADIDVKLTSMFSNNQASGSFVRSILYIDPRTLTFTRDEPGWVQAKFDVSIAAFGDNGQTVARITQSETARVPEPQWEQARSNGIVYVSTLPIKFPGAYQMRVVVRDSISQKLGSARQFVEVPNLTHGGLVLSGLLLSPDHGPESNGLLDNEEQSKSMGANGEERPNSGAGRLVAVSKPSLWKGPAVREFHPGASLDVTFVLLNAPIDKSAHPDAQWSILKDDKPILEGNAEIIAAMGRVDPMRAPWQAAISLPKDFEPGHYVLQVTCADKAEAGKRHKAIQWIDFDVVQ
ncbi:MAG TPA: VWA domain-containing protein [Blastocatellia bacterium]